MPSAAAARSRQSCPTLCDPIDGSPPGSPIPGVLQARTLEWVAISFSNAWKWKVKVKLLSRVRLLATPWTAACQAPPSMGFSRQEYWSGLPLPSPDALCSTSQRRIPHTTLPCPHPQGYDLRGVNQLLLLELVTFVCCAEPLSHVRLVETKRMQAAWHWIMSWQPYRERPRVGSCCPRRWACSCDDRCSTLPSVPLLRNKKDILFIKRTYSFQNFQG